MPIPAKELNTSGGQFLRLLIMGPSKVGKTSAAATAPGRRYVIECDPGPEYALGPLKRKTDDFDYDIVRKSTARPNDNIRSNHYAWYDIMAACKAARDGVAAGTYKTIILDTLSEFAESLENECAQATMNSEGEPDGRRYWYVYEKRLRHVLSQLFMIPAHVIVTTHYVEVGNEEGIANEKGEKGTPKRGKGLVPLLGGKARGTIPSMFNDVVFMDVIQQNKRVFTTGPLGAWGPGCRSMEGAVQIDADIGELMKLFKEGFKPVTRGVTPTLSSNVKQVKPGPIGKPGALRAPLKASR